MATDDSIYVGMLVALIKTYSFNELPPPPQQPKSQLLQVQQVAMCPVRAVFGP
jgi:hypothetical protein